MLLSAFSREVFTLLFVVSSTAAFTGIAVSTAGGLIPIEDYGRWADNVWGEGAWAGVLYYVPSTFSVGIGSVI